MTWDRWDPPPDAWQVPEWHADALCKGLDPALFFPEQGDNISTEVRAICAACPVRVPCLIAGQAERYGFWGGQVAGHSASAMKQRRRLRARGAA